MDRRTISRLLLAVPLLAAGLALGAPHPVSAAAVCNTTIVGGTIKENIVVPAGTACRLEGVTVRGGVTVEPGARFNVVFETVIRGSVTATAPASFTINFSVVRGGVTVTGGTDMQLLRVGDSQVRGDLVLTGNATILGEGIVVQQNIVRGSVVLRNNTAGGSFRVEANVIDLNLDCSDNSPDPSDSGFTNTVGGVGTGECVGLAAP